MSNYLETWLVHGRAPAYWQRQIAQDTAWLDDVTHACAWLASITNVQVTLNAL